MSTSQPVSRRVTLTLAGLIALVSAALVLAVSGAHRANADAMHTHKAATVAVKTNAKQAAFHDAMRKLWEDHVTWTRLAIVSYIADLPDLEATRARLLKNQEDIGNAIKPFYGKAAGDKLTALLKEHIAGAVNLMAAAKSGDQAQITQRSDEWYANGNQVADFLSAANRKAWPRTAMRGMMKGHLDQTLDEAVNQLKGNYAASARDYDEIHQHILKMADALSDGIIKQFPKKFR